MASSSRLTARLTTKGQLTVPKRVRDKLGIGPGDELEFVEEGGEVLVRKRIAASPFEPYVGCLQDKEGQDPDQLVGEMRGHD